MRIVLALCLLFWGSTAMATTTANEILKLCDASRPLAEAESNFSCFLYYTGVMDGLMSEWARIKTDGGSLAFCPPGEVNEIQIREIMWRYTVSHPEKWHEYAGWLARDALADAFPCDN